MKELTREVTTTEVYAYEAVDGTQFKTVEDCVKYEGSYKVVIYDAYKRRVLGSITEYELTGLGCDDNVFDIVSIKNANDLTAVNQYIVLCYGAEHRQLDESAIGTTQLIEHYWDCPFDWVYPVGSMEDFVDRMLDKYRAKLAELANDSDK